MTVRQLRDNLNKVTIEAVLDTEIEATLFGENERVEDFSIENASFGCIQRKNLFKPIAGLTLVKKENEQIDQNKYDLFEEEK